LEEVHPQRFRFQPAFIYPRTRLVARERMNQQATQELRLQFVQRKARQFTQGKRRDQAGRLVVGFVQAVEQVTEECGPQFLRRVDLRQERSRELKGALVRREQPCLEPLRRQLTSAEALAQDVGGQFVPETRFEKCPPGVQANVLAWVTRTQQV